MLPRSTHAPRNVTTIRLPLGQTLTELRCYHALHMHQGMLPTIRLPLGQTSDRAMLTSQFCQRSPRNVSSTHAPRNVTYIRLPLGQTSDRLRCYHALHMLQGMLPTIRLPLGQTSDRTAMLHLLHQGAMCRAW